MVHRSMTQRNAPAVDMSMVDPSHPAVIRGTLGKQFVTGLANDFARHGGRMFRKLRKRRQQDYLKLVAALLPKEYRVKEVEFPEEGFEKILQALKELIAEKEKSAAERTRK
jgi:hypothetical protein